VGMGTHYLGLRPVVRVSRLIVATKVSSLDQTARLDDHLRFAQS
jgi:hypothetical protein